jgi:hypothetical protein
MTEKTLGQVLYDEVIGNYERQRLLAPWSALDELDRADYERLAQAVAAIVREQCAQAGDALAVVDPECDAHDGWNSGIRRLQSAIRSMK